MDKYFPLKLSDDEKDEINTAALKSEMIWAGQGNITQFIRTATFKEVKRVLGDEK